MYKRILFTLFAALLAGAAWADAWPSRPVRLIVNFPAGSGPDVMARSYGKLLSEEIGQPVVIDNKIGAGGNIGMEIAARSAPDGYTLLWTPGSTLVTNMFLYKTYNHELAKSLQPIAAIFYQPLPLVVRADAPFRTAAELVQYGKANPDKLRYGTSGTGSPLHLAALMLMSQGGFSAQHVPYKVTGEAVIGLINGDIDFYFDAGAATPMVKQGRLRSLALAGRGRSEMHGDVPSLLEATGANVDVTLPGGVFAPGKTPAPIVEALHSASERIWKSPQFKTALAPIYAEPAQTYLSTAQIQSALAKDRERIGQLLKDMKIAAEF